jgi:hypothetical protein
MSNRVPKAAGHSRIDRTMLAESPARKSIRALKLTAVQSRAIRELLQPLAETEDIVEGFFQDCAELNPYTALMILEGYEHDGFYKLGSAKALHRLLTTFIQDQAPSKVLRHDFSTPVWLITPEKMEKIRKRDRMELVTARRLLETQHQPRVQTDVKPVAQDTTAKVKVPATTGILNKKDYQSVIKFPGLPKNNP